MSKIWLARQIGQERDVVVKMLKEHLRSNAKAVKNAIRGAHGFAAADLHNKIREKVAELPPQGAGVAVYDPRD